MTVGDRIRRAREAKGMNQASLAKLIGVSQQSVQFIENGRTKQPRHIQKIAQILDTSPEWLLFGTNPDNKNLPTGASRPEGFVPVIKWDQVDKWGDPDADLLNDSTEWVPMFDNEAGPNSYCLDIINDAMTNPQHQDSFVIGQRILVNPDLQAINGDYVIVASKEAGNIFRQLVIDGKKSFLKALNPEYLNPMMDLKEDDKIVGVVISVTKKIRRK